MCKASLEMKQLSTKAEIFSNPLIVDCDLNQLQLHLFKKKIITQNQTFPPV